MHPELQKRKRRHLVSRMAKAAAFAREVRCHGGFAEKPPCYYLQQYARATSPCVFPSPAQAAQIASNCCDTATVLQVEAYALAMRASMMLEKEVQWERALAKFMRARWVSYMWRWWW